MALIKYKSVGKNNLPNTKTTCLVSCDSCNIEFNRRYKTRIKHLKNKEIAGDFCSGCFQKLPEARKKMSKSIREMKKRNPDWAAKISRTSKGKINLGDKNGMKQKEARKKVSIARKEMFKDPEERAKLSRKMIKAWANGRYDGVKVGRCKWYDYEKKDGTIAKCQGTWELAYAKWLDENNIGFIAHRGRIKYRRKKVVRSYYPDFYLIESDEYIDIKNQYHFSLNSEKFDMIRRQNPKLKIIILFRHQLEEMGVKL
jgi:hypothetical protein